MPDEARQGHEGSFLSWVACPSQPTATMTEAQTPCCLESVVGRAAQEEDEEEEDEDEDEEDEEDEY